jgi:hypothetical protein
MKLNIDETGGEIALPEPAFSMKSGEDVDL